VRSHSIIIAWETSSEVDGVVEYGTTQAYGSTASDFNWTTRHAVTLEDLNSHTTYRYRVKTRGQVLSDDRTFKSAAGPGQTSFTFVVIGDTHSGVFEFPRRQREIDAMHRANVDTIAAIAPGFFIHVGDLVEEGSDLAGWNDFFAIEGNLMSRIAMFPTLGNHERNHQNYFDLFYLPHNERWYSFDYGNAHFICLEIDGYGDPSPGGEQYLWLQSDLANTDKTWRFVFFHFPAYNSGYYGSDPGAQAYLVPLFQQYGVDVVFSGHQHNYQRNVADGITYFVTGGGGQFTNSPGSFAWTMHSEETRHILKLSITGNTLGGVAVRPDGSEFDPFTLTAD